MSSKIAVIGAINLDINIHTSTPYLLHDSNLIDAIQNVGGVGGNIAQNVARLGNEVTLFTIFGNDPVSQSLQQSLEQLGIDTTYAKQMSQPALNLYISIQDEKKDLLLGLNDMKAMNHLDVNYITEQATILATFDTIVIDTNLNQSVIEYIAKTYQDKRLVMDAVSVAKMPKLMTSIPYLSILKVNQLEYELLTDEDHLLQSFVKEAITNGRLELLHSNQEQTIMVHHQHEITTVMPKPCSTIVNSSGAGDALLSGYLHGRLQHKSIQESLEIATQVAYLTLLSPTSTSNEVKPIG